MHLRILAVCAFLVILVTFAWPNVIGGRAEYVPSPPEPRILDPIDGTLGSAYVLPASTGSGVQFFPIGVSPEWVLTERIVPLHEALRDGVVEIREGDRMDQYRLYMRNYGGDPVLGQAGDFFGGGRQDRFSRSDFLAPENSAWLPLDVLCAEFGRSTGPSDRFGWGGRGAPQVRGRVLSGAQEGVWDEIRRMRSDMPDALPDTTSYGAIARSEAIRAEADALAGRYAGHAMPRDTIGIACTLNGRVLGLDVYGSPELFGAQWPLLVQSYLVEASRIGIHDHGGATADDVRLAIEQTRRAGRRPIPSIGLGETWRLDGRASATGMALTYHGRVVHLAMLSTMPTRHFR